MYEYIELEEDEIFSSSKYETSKKSLPGT